MTDFAGWLMPLRYGSETSEHLAVRSSAGLFDLSHMGEIAVSGPSAAEALDYALTGWISRLKTGQARYTMICAPDGGIIDDLVVYRQAETRFLVIANASNASVVLAELSERCAATGAEVTDETGQTALVAIQGPNAPAILSQATPLPLADIRYYSGMYGDVAGVPAWVARTGYTGEDGFEVFCPADAAELVWDALAKAGGSGVVPAGLAARDTLRLEAGMPLYGNELGRDVSPYEAGLGKVVRLDKPADFVGRAALATAATAERDGSGPDRELIGLIGQSRRIPRHGYPVLSDGARVGTVTSGAPSPTLAVPVAMAFVERGAKGPFFIDVRGRLEPADRTQLPFYRRSQQA
jgi:glycine cleavage system T protein (aminomethyltransferase)